MEILFYTRFELSSIQSDLDKLNPTKIRALEREVSDKGLVILKSTIGTNGAQNSLLVGNNVSSARSFREIVSDLDLPYVEKETYAR